MKKSVKWILRVLLWLFLAFIALSIAATVLPMGKGSMRYARKWTQRLEQYVSLADVTNGFEYLDVTGTPGRGWDGDLTLLTFTNGNWVVLNTANSHANPWGGTMVTRDSTGRTRVFFGHVCGGETLRGDSLDEAYSNLVSGIERREVFLDSE